MPRLACVTLALLLFSPACSGGLAGADDQEDEADIYDPDAEIGLELSNGLVGTADTYARDGARAASNFGRESRVRADQQDSGDQLFGYLRFDLSAVAGKVTRAALRVYVTNGTIHGPEFFATDPAWSETTLTWNNRPTPGAALASIASAHSGSWLEVDVSQALTAGPIISLVLVPRSADGFAFSSRETSRPPRLVLEFAPSDAGVGLVPDAGTPRDAGALPLDAGSLVDAGSPPADAGTFDAGQPGRSGWADCLARPGSTTTTVSGPLDVYRPSHAANDWNVDLGATTFLGYPSVSRQPIFIGSTSDSADRVCVAGGIVIGQQTRTGLTWRQMHDDIGGGAYLVTTGPGQWSRIDGIRVDNVEDALKPRGRDGRWELHNAYMQYIRDDCVENDETAPGGVYDSLLDGCYTAFSEQLQNGCCNADPGETFVVERSLVRLQKMPGPYDTTDTSILAHGKFFKWMDTVPHPVIIRDTIFSAEAPNSTSNNWPFPPGTVTTNVTIVWLGTETWHWPVPPGTTVTTDRSVWDRARQRWLDRHGCTSFEHCTRLLDPVAWP